MSHVEDILRQRYAEFRQRYPALPPNLYLRPDPLGDWAIAWFKGWQDDRPLFSFDVLSTDKNPTLWLTSHEYAHALHYAGGGDPRAMWHLLSEPPYQDPVMDGYFRARGFPPYMDYAVSLQERVKTGNGRIIWGEYPGEMFAESIAVIVAGGTERAMTFDIPFSPERKAAVDAFAKSLKNVRNEEDMDITELRRIIQEEIAKDNARDATDNAIKDFMHRHEHDLVGKAIGRTSAAAPAWPPKGEV